MAILVMGRLVSIRAPIWQDDYHLLAARPGVADRRPDAGALLLGELSRRRDQHLRLIDDCPVAGEIRGRHPALVRAGAMRPQAGGGRRMQDDLGVAVLTHNLMRLGIRPDAVAMVELGRALGELGPQHPELADAHALAGAGETDL